MKERTAAESQLFKELSLVWNKSADPVLRTNTILALRVWINCLSEEFPLHVRRHHFCAYLDRKSDLQGYQFYHRVSHLIYDKTARELLLRADAPKISKLVECSAWSKIKESRKVFPEERGHVLLYVRAYYALAADCSVKNDEWARNLYRLRLGQKEGRAKAGRKGKGGDTKTKAYKPLWGRRLPFLWAAYKAKIFMKPLAPACPVNLFSKSQEKREEYEEQLERFGGYLAWAIANTKSSGIKKDEIESWNLPPSRFPTGSKVTAAEWDTINVGSAGRKPKERKSARP